MKRRTGFLLSTISTAAVTVVLGAPIAAAVPLPKEMAPIERLASIRASYLASLTDAQGFAESNDQIAQFQNFPNFSNWRNL
jgi:hypothetical protein